MPEYSLTLYDRPKTASDPLTTMPATLGNVTRRFPDWHHTTASIWGCKEAGGTFVGSESEKLRFFMNSIGRMIVFSDGSINWWKGMIVGLYLTRYGHTISIEMADMANKVQVIYSKIGPNLFSNGDVESSAWTQVGSPSTHERATTQRWRGTYSMHVVTDAADEGTQVESGVSITAGRSYICRVSVEVISGNWTLYLEDGSGSTISSRAASGTGKEVLQTRISETNAETSITVELRADGSGAEIYADNAVLQLAPARTETEWFEDTVSQSEFGTMEAIDLQRGMTDAQAEGHAQRLLKRHAWPFVRGPQGGEIISADEEGEPATLEVVLAGMALTMSFKHLLAGGETTASAAITSLVGEAEFVSAGYIQSNSTDVKVEDANPTTLWEAVSEVTEAGDGSGDSWMAGVYPDRDGLDVLNYRARPSIIDYEIVDGLLRINGRNVIKKPWEYRPGYAVYSDLPQLPAQFPGTGTTEQPNVVWLDEVIFEAPNKVKWKQERRA